MTYTWADVQKGQIADDAAINDLGNTVELHDASINNLSAVAMAYRARSQTTGVVPSVTIPGIPSTLRRLSVTWSARGDAAVQAQLMFVQIGGDTSAVYSYAYILQQNTAVNGVAVHGDTRALCGTCSGSAAGAGVYGSGSVDFATWDGASSLGLQHSSEVMGTAVANHFHATGGATYTGVNGRTSITFLPQTGNFISGCDFQLEGWA